MNQVENVVILQIGKETLIFLEFSDRTESLLISPERVEKTTSKDAQIQIESFIEVKHGR